MFTRLPCSHALVTRPALAVQLLNVKLIIRTLNPFQKRIITTSKKWHLQIFKILISSVAVELILPQQPPAIFSPILQRNEVFRPLCRA
jgi:hypothetical protein